MVNDTERYTAELIPSDYASWRYSLRPALRRSSPESGIGLVSPGRRRGMIRGYASPRLGCSGPDIQSTETVTKR